MLTPDPGSNCLQSSQTETDNTKSKELKGTYTDSIE